MRIEADDVDVDEELATEQIFDTQHGEGHTYNPQQAADQGLSYTPPTDPPTVPSKDDPQGVEIAAGFAPSMEHAEIDVEDLPTHLDDSDLEIRDDVLEALRYNSETADLTGIAVAVREGIVYLVGIVPTEDDIAQVYNIVGDLEGVVRIVNHLQVGS